MADDNDIEIWRKQLYFRSQRRGFREVDLLFKAFAEKHLPKLDRDQLGRFDALQSVPDWQLYHWVVGKEVVPAEHNHDVFALLRDYEIPRVLQSR